MGLERLEDERSGENAEEVEVVHLVLLVYYQALRTEYLAAHLL
jgi:hypothetical protein